VNLRKLLVPVFGVAVMAAAWRSYGWGGVALVASGFVTWMLLHFNRITDVLSKAALRPVGHVDSAVMLNVKLRRGETLLRVLSTTHSIGERLSPDDQQPEIYRWSDETQSHVTCEFRNGKLVKWVLERPAEPASESPPR
jgi:hypothetical protein